MEQYNEERVVKSNIYDTFDGFKSFLSSFLGVFVALIGIGVVFVVSSLEGAKEIKASNKENAILVALWRESNETLFPESRVDVIEYKNQEYYFVVEETNEQGEVIKWYFAYEGGIEYVFGDYKFYILSAITMMVSIFVSQINYVTARNGAMNTTKFLKTMKTYQDSKQQIAKFSQYIPMFCSYKNKQLYDDTKREIVESANISYDLYNDDSFEMEELEPWQKKILEDIKKIKIERISPSDLLQEKSNRSKRKSLLPISPEKHNRSYLIKSAITKLVSSALSGTVVALGVVLGNWFLGITYGFTVLLSFITSNVTGADYANSGLRQRYIAKADLLNEFHNMVDFFIEEEKRQKIKQEIKHLEEEKKLNQLKDEFEKENKKEKENFPIVNVFPVLVPNKN